MRKRYVYLIGATVVFFLSIFGPERYKETKWAAFYILLVMSIAEGFEP